MELQKSEQAAVEAAVLALPVRSYHKAGEGAEDVCAVCLSSFDEGDLLRELPCHHAFHKNCIDCWLLPNASTSRSTAEFPSCPLCKSVVVVPASEVDSSTSPVEPQP